ncbi:hypothetical protein LP52_05105 [Streptomonospora alba]|uniref:ATPase AAA-type core domain-containing protein n=1 Tax=Streptomonospora alba TaxID=183763 RepID=A0A0C2JE97_9ACTN|nr:DUF3696 domain-containing protein [Streptomonospora alba]KIH99646.1 hypothetical protein LP52_05105 [Streptomonospora alba]
MALSRFSVENYRCFDDRQDIELGRITVVLGKNNSGKSALVRAPLVLSTGVRTQSSLPLDLDLLGDAAPTFSDLIYGGNPHGRVQLGLDFEHEAFGPFGLEATIQNIDEWQTQVISELVLRANSTATQMTWDYKEDESAWSSRRSYRVRNPEECESSLQSLSFRGLLPAEIREPTLSSSPTDFAASVIREGFDRIRYLGPFRERPEWVARLPSRAPLAVGSSGEEALGMIGYDAVRGRRQIIDKINDLLSEHLPGWKFEVHSLDDRHFTLDLSALTEKHVKVNLRDAGTGVAQLLPLLTQRAMDAAQSPQRPVLQVVEEPELHLHPSAHAMVADLLLRGSRETAVRYLVETHSETFLLRLRRRVAEGEIAPEDLSIYFVEHSEGSAQARRVGVDRLGNLDYWPTGVFSEDFEEARALTEAQSRSMER